jgi:hypothetical protein
MMGQPKQKTGPKGPRPQSLATTIRAMMIAGLSDAMIAHKLKKRSPKVSALVKWHRWRMTRDAKRLAEVLR